jgi:hypothetical protein
MAMERRRHVVTEPEKPWWRQLDGLPPSPHWWPDSGWFQVGLLGTIIGGCNTLLRVAFPYQLPGPAWFWALLTAPFAIALLEGSRRA